MRQSLAACLPPADPGENVPDKGNIPPNVTGVIRYVRRAIPSSLVIPFGHVTVSTAPRMATNRVLILFAHPALQKSRVHRHLIEAAHGLPDVTFHDLYEEYPDLHINVTREQNLLLAHDIVVFQHPFYWYSCPALLKEWQDLVLEYGFAYGENGNALHGKSMISAITTGGPADSYHTAGFNSFTVRQFLAPFEQTARLCGMHFLPPWVLHGTHRLSREEVNVHVKHYRELLEGLRDGQITQRSVAHLSQLPVDLAGIPEGSHARR